MGGAPQGGISFDGGGFKKNYRMGGACPPIPLWETLSIVAHSPAGLMYIAYELVILVHINIQVTNLMIGYIQFHQGSER